jgi:hypothetical protein
MLFQGFFAFFVGLIFAYCTLRYSIKWSMLLHIANNGLAVIVMFLEPSLFLELSIYMFYLTFALIAGFLGYKAFREQLQSGKPSSIYFALGMPLGVSGMPMGYPPKAKPYTIAFSSAWLIVGLTIATLLSAVMQFI